MNLNSKYFKYLFRTETVIGMNTVSADGLDQKLWKTVYTCSIMTCTIIGLVHSLAYENPNIGLTFYVARTTQSVLLRFVLFYAFITAVHDYRTKVTAILNLEAIERRLSTEKSGGPDTTLAETGVSLLSLALYVVHWAETVTELMTGPRSIPKLFTSFHFNLFKCCQFYGCLLFTTKCYRVQKEINKLLDTLFEEGAIKDRSRNKYRLTRSEKVKNLREATRNLKTLQGALFDSEMKIKSYYWIYVAWFAITSAVMTPIIVISTSDVKNYREFLGLNATLLSYVAFTVAVVVAFEQIRDEQDAALGEVVVVTHADTHVEDDVLRTLTHQILAHHHRHASSSSFYLFHVDFSLLADIFDTTLMIACTLLS